MYEMESRSITLWVTRRILVFGTLLGSLDERECRRLLFEEYSTFLGPAERNFLASMQRIEAVKTYLSFAVCLKVKSPLKRRQIYLLMYRLRL